MPAHARGATPPDVVVEAGTLPALFRQLVLAAPNGVEPANDGQRAPKLCHIGVGTEIAGPGNVASAGDQHPRKGLAEGHGYGGVTLVVLESDVESRAVLLDQVVFQDQGARLVRHHKGFHVGDQTLEQAIPWAIGKVGCEVAPHPVSEPFCLADIEHLTILPFPEVNPRPLRKGIELSLE